MKELTALVLLMLASLMATAQTTVNDFRDKYEDHDDATSVTIKGNLFELLGDIAEFGDDEETQMAARMFKGINSMKILSLPLYDVGVSKQEITDLKSSLEKEGFEEYINIREGKEMVNVYAQGTKENISNLIIITQERDDFAIIHIDGSLKHKDIAYIIEHHDEWGDNMSH